MDPMNPTLSAQERKNTIKNLFLDLVQFVELLQNDEEINVNCLTKLEELQEYARKQLLSRKTINNHEQEIVSYLQNAFQSSLKLQLSSYWNCWTQIIKSSKQKHVYIRKKTNEYISQIQEVDSMRQELDDQHPEKNNIALYATFYIHIVTVEKIEYALQQDLQEYSADIADFDIESMFSLGDKVKRKRGKFKYVTRGRAMRDALAHKKFKIDSHGEQKHIAFENKDCGYDFQEQLTVDEFLEYVRGSNMLYKIMYTLQSFMLLSTLLRESLDLD